MYYCPLHCLYMYTYINLKPKETCMSLYYLKVIYKLFPSVSTLSTLSCGAWRGLVEVSSCHFLSLPLTHHFYLCNTFTFTSLFTPYNIRETTEWESLILTL